MYERVFMAALDSRRYPEAKVCLEKLQTQFPQSNRVKVLTGMLHETKSKFKNALSVYNEVIKADPGNMAARKRKVCIFKTEGRTKEAIQELNGYLQLFATDIDAWQELTQLYIQTQRLPLAKFCVEELILLKPENYLYHIQYAELCYSLQDYSLAKQYYAQALELKPEGNLRALYGMLLSVRALQTSSEIDVKTYTHVYTRLMSEYSAAKGVKHISDVVTRSLALNATLE